MRAKKIFLLLFSIILPLICSGCYAPILKKEITMPFFEKKPEIVLGLMVKKTLDLESYHVKDHIHINIVVDQAAGNIPASFSKETKLEAIMEGDVDLRDENNSKSTSNTDLNVESGILKFNLGLESIFLGKNKNYYKIKNLPFQGLIEIIGKDFTIDEWYKLDFDELQRIVENLDNRAAALNIKEQEKQTKIIKNKIKEAVKKYHLLILDERLRDEKINSRKMYHYKVRLNKADLLSLFLEIANDIKADLEKEKIPSISMEKVDESIKKFLSYIDDARGEVWIDKKDFSLNKMIFDIRMGTPANEIKADINLTAEISNFNQNIDIKEPENAKSIIKIFEKYLNESRMKSRDIKRISDVNQLRTALELYFSDFDAYPDKLDKLSKNEKKIVYMSKLPQDPLTTKAYQYFSIGKLKKNYIMKTQAEYAEKKEWVILTPAGIFSGDQNKDSDKDELFDAEEEQWGTDPGNPDTDRDGYKDGAEVKNGYNPDGLGKL